MKYFFLAQLATAKRIKVDTIITRAILPPDLSETQTAHIETNVSGRNVKVCKTIF